MRCVRIFNNEKKIIVIKRKKLLLLILTLFFSYYCYKSVAFYSEELKNMLLVKAQNNFVLSVNDSVSKVCSKKEFNFLEISYSDGKITGIDYNTKDINIFKAEVIKNIINCYENSFVFKVYYTDAFNNPVFLNKGPSFNVKCSLIGGVSANLLSKFESVGVNQSKNSIYFEICGNFYTGTNVFNTSDEFKYTVLVSESIIVGDVPESYTNVESGEDLKDTVLNLQ